jgi:hypothetical protein
MFRGFPINGRVIKDGFVYKKKEFKKPRKRENAERIIYFSDTPLKRFVQRGHFIL